MDFKLYFAGSRDYALKHAPTMSVVLWPDEDRSPDLGYRIQARMLVRMHLAPHVIRTPIAFIAQDFKDCAKAMELELKGGQFVEVTAEWLGSKFSIDTPPKDGDSRHWFATLQGNIDSYRELTRAFGPDSAIEALNAAHDVVALNPKYVSPGLAQLAISSDAFKLAVLRSNERYFAFRRAASVLHGNEAEALEMTEARATVRFHLAGFKGLHEVTIDFRRSQLFDRRINVLIGENGVGKSQTLAHIVSSLAKMKNGGSIASTEPFSRVIAFSAVPGQSSLPKKLRSQRTLLYRHFALSPRSDRRRGDNELSTALIDLARDATRIAGRSRVQIFKEALESWLPLTRIGLRVKAEAQHDAWHYAAVDGHFYLPVARLLEPLGDGAIHLFADLDTTKPPAFFARRRNSEGEYEDDVDDALRPEARASHPQSWGQRPSEPRGLQPLSSGQELFFRFSLNLSTFIEAGTLVLIDEPENHLHPTFITRLMSLLRQVLQSTGSFAVIATHSPFVVREVTRMDVSIMGRMQDGSALVRHPRLQTLGASVAAVSGYVFGDETIPTLARLTVEAMAQAREGTDPNSEEWLKLLSRELSNEAVGYIRAELMRSERESEN